MRKSTPKFLGFRGNVILPDQTSLQFNYELQEKSGYKNSIFCKVFLKVKDCNRISTKIRGRMYYLYFVKQFDENIYQYKLVKKASIKKHDLGEADITESQIDDYPYIHIFVHLHSQKLLIELNESIFSDYMYSKVVLEKLINSELSPDESCIKLVPITDEMKFWSFIENNSYGICEVDFSLKAPNFLDGGSAAEDFLREFENKTKSTSVDLKLSNEEAGLSLKRENIDSFVKYASSGAGEWTIKKKTANGKTETIKSKDKCRKVSLPVSMEHLKKGIVNIITLKNAFNRIETIKKFMEENNVEGEQGKNDKE